MIAAWFNTVPILGFYWHADCSMPGVAEGVILTARTARKDLHAAMLPAERHSFRSRRRYWRAFWLLGLLCHFPLTLRAVSTVWAADTPAIDWAKLLAITVCNAFFLIEIAWAPCLRLVPNRRTAVAWLLVIAVLHAGVIDHRLPDLAALRGSSGWLLLSAIGAATVSRWLRKLTQSLRTSFALVCNFDFSGRFARWATTLFRVVRPPPLFAWRIMPLRAPPIV